MKKVFYNKVLLTVFFIVSFITISYAQGGWDLAYVPVDSIQSNWIGKEIRLDFKSSSSDNISGDVSSFKIRNLLSKRDTVTLVVNGKEAKYIENWELHVDHGILSDQSLSEISEKYLINEIFIEAVNDSTITVKINFYKPKKCKSEKLILSDSKDVVIDKKIVKGLLYRRNDE